MAGGYSETPAKEQGWAGAGDQPGCLRLAHYRDILNHQRAAIGGDYPQEDLIELLGGFNVNIHLGAVYISAANHIIRQQLVDRRRDLGRTCGTRGWICRIQTNHLHVCALGYTGQHHGLNPMGRIQAQHQAGFRAGFPHGCRIVVNGVGGGRILQAPGGSRFDWQQLVRLLWW